MDVKYAARGEQAVIIPICRIIASIKNVRVLFIPIFTSMSIVVDLYRFCGHDYCRKKCSNSTGLQ
jgi:hypothetical protein